MIDWQPSRACPGGLDSSDGRFRIVPAPGTRSGAVILLDFERDDREGDVWRKRFGSAEQAQAFAAAAPPVPQQT